ncbi:cell division protein FtsA [Ktedonosporobacter rubrisoli]|uniref:Cell division protein FtsA n=1 Tax=Ktedonosporobacter rubrisoli TaxID=2509675 RepID=A0A4P6JQD3_KTERU|nr:cell division protein FtsA [Ktedonosporobacter rubrisoli]QBD77619.1 cell division protein FtsA [Ktedonosporobacter rubrisoli]
MMIVGIDVGTTKTCVLVGKQDHAGRLTIVGASTSPARGIRRGIIVDIDEAVASITMALDRAERLSGEHIRSAYVSISGRHIGCLNSTGAVTISPLYRDITEADIRRTLEAARAIVLPAGHEVLHVIPRGYTLDGQDGIENPVSMAGFLLEVEAHIITGASTSINSLVRCMQGLNVGIDELIVGGLASSEAVLEEGESDLGVAVLDIGGGTTDISIFTKGSIAYTTALPLGGDLITNDIAIGLQLPFSVAEKLKITYGHSNPAMIDDHEMIDIGQFMPGRRDRISRKLLAEIIEARVEEICGMIGDAIQTVSYGDWLPAGVVVTGGTALLPGLLEMVEQELDLPARLGTPDRIHGLDSSLDRSFQLPAFSTAIGLLLWGARHSSLDSEEEEEQFEDDEPPYDNRSRISDWLRTLIVQKLKPAASTEEQVGILSAAYSAGSYTLALNRRSGSGTF